MECPICLEQKDDMTTTICNHQFCKNCIGTIIVTSIVCPLCRGLLLDETISVKALNESIKHLLSNVSKKKRKRFLNEYKRLQQKVNDGSLKEDELGQEIITSLITITGEDARLYIRLQIHEAVIYRDTYMDMPYDDWRLPYLKILNIA
jgi:hypothetical protein